MATMAEANALANALGIQKEIVYGFVNAHNGRLPGSLDELNQWGSQPDPNYGIVRRQGNGAWSPIVPGANPMRANLPPGTNDGQAGAWGITNAEDSRIEPSFQFADPSGVGARITSGDPSALSAFGGGGSATGGYATKNGNRSLEQMKAELAVAGYSGPQDDQSIVDAYKRTSGGDVTPAPGGSTGGSGLAGMLDAAGRLSTADFGLRNNADQRAQRDQNFNQQNTQDTNYAQNRNADLNRAQQDNQYNLNRYDQNNQYAQNQYQNRLTTEENRGDTRLNSDLQNQQYQQGRFDTQRAGDRSLYSNLAQNLLNGAVQLSGQPRDYFKYNQMLSGGKDIFQQMFGDQPRADFSGFTGGAPESGRISDLMSALGMPQLPGGSAGQGSAAAEQQFLGAQGIRPMGTGDFFGPQADAREQQWLGSRVGPAPYIGPEPYTPRPDLPFMPPVTDRRQQATDVVPKLKDAYQAALKQYGVPFLSADDPRLLRIYQDVTGLDETGARRVAQQAADYSKDTGGVIPDSFLAGHIAQAFSDQTNTNPDLNRARNVTDAYGRQVQASGQPYLGPDDPRTRQVYQDVGGLDPMSAMNAARQAHQQAGAQGYAPGASDVMGIIENARRQGQNPNQPYQQVRGLNAGYQTALGQTGQSYLGQNDPQLRGLYQQYGGLNPQQAAGAAQGAADWSKTTGSSIPDPMQYLNIQRNRRQAQPAYAA